MYVHFIAIGGSAMHNLALALHQEGYRVTGSDDAIFEPSRSRLQAKGLMPDVMGWFPEKIAADLDFVILGMHAKEDNPELKRALELGITVYSYPEFLYEHSKHKTRVVISGSHGKTTITSMVLHVLNYHNRDVDYMVGAQLEGFENMVKLTEINDFMIMEGDEYLSSTLDKRPKFHVYKPNIALLSGIAWDHVNVFHTYDSYVEQFRVFIETIVDGGILVYNAQDSEVKKLAEATQKPIRKHAYTTPKHRIYKGKTILETSEGDIPLNIFGAHNLSNLSGAKWICQHMGVDESDFYEAISSFYGASKRLEVIQQKQNSVIFKDFAHSPSKVKATTEALKAQYPDRKLVACLELHTYSSLNPLFLNEYKNTLKVVDVAAVFYDLKALELKRMTKISKDDILKAFSKPDLHVFDTREDFENFILSQNVDNVSIVFMSSGNFGGIDLEAFACRLIN